MNSQKTEARRPGKPDLSLLDAKKAADFVDRGHDERAPLPLLPAAPAQLTQAEVVPDKRIPKISVSLRVPQNITDTVMEMAAKETLSTKIRVTPHDIYLRAIIDYIYNTSK